MKHIAEQFPLPATPPAPEPTAPAKRKASAKVRALAGKLEALAERAGTDGEAAAALAKLDRLRARYDLTAPAGVEANDLFAGAFKPARFASPLCEIAEPDIAASVKWAIEERTGISCLFHGRQLMAEAAPGSLQRLAQIAATVSGSFIDLTRRFASATGAEFADRQCFIMGLYDGMMQQEKPAGQLLPARQDRPRPHRGKRGALAGPVGLAVHPYTLAAKLGREIRFSVPLESVTHALYSGLAGQIEQTSAPG